MPKSVLTDMLQLGTLWRQLHTKLGPTETQHGERCFKQSVIDSKQTRKIPVKTSVLRISDRAGYVPRSEAIWISTWADMIETVWQICPLASTPKLSRLSTFGAGGFFCRQNLIENRDRDPKRLTCICIYMFWMFRSMRASQVRRWWNGPPAVVRTTPPPKVGSATCPAFPESNLTRPMWLISNDSTTAHLRASWICWWVWPILSRSEPHYDWGIVFRKIWVIFFGFRRVPRSQIQGKDKFCGVPPCTGCSQEPCNDCFAGHQIYASLRPGCDGNNRGIGCVPPKSAMGDLGADKLRLVFGLPPSSGEILGCASYLIFPYNICNPPPPQPAPQGGGGIPWTHCICCQQKGLEGYRDQGYGRRGRHRTWNINKGRGKERERERDVYI